MADPKKVRWSQLKVGIVGLFAFLILSVLIFLLTSSRGFFQANAILYTYMDDASGMAEGTPVRLNGFTIGSLEKIQLTTSNDPKKSVQFVMKVLEKFLPQIPVDSVAGISAANLLGDKFVNITKGRASQTVKDGAEIRSLQAQDIPELMAQSAALLQSFQTIVNRIDSLLAGVEQGKGNIGKLLKDDALHKRLDELVARFNGTIDKINSGQGTLGQLVVNPELYNSLNTATREFQSLAKDMRSNPRKFLTIRLTFF